MPKIVTVSLSGILLAYIVFMGEGDISLSWGVALVCLSLLTIAYWLSSSTRKSAPLDYWLLIPLILSVSYGPLQLLPLPSALVNLISPARAAIAGSMAAALNENTGFNAFSVAPVSTVAYSVRIASYVLVFLLVRQLVWRSSRNPWLLALPACLIALLEAILGIVQHVSSPTAYARGTYLNRDHFAGLLEMALPFAALYPLEAWRKSRDEGSPRAAVKIVAAVCVAFTLLLGIQYSYSRMGFAATVGSLITIAILGVFSSASLSRRMKIGAAAVIAVLVLAILVSIAPMALIERYSEGEYSMRASIWRDSVGMIAAYPLVGCGLGTFGDAFYHFQRGSLDWAILAAHNDYIQVLVESGVVGFSILAMGMAVIGFGLLRLPWRGSDRSRYLALACTGSIVAILLHSIADFNLYVIQNAVVFAWILGISSGLALNRPSPEPRESH